MHIIIIINKRAPTTALLFLPEQILRHHQVKFCIYSPKQYREVNETVNILEEDVVYDSGVQNTRWLASRHRAICALEKHKAGTSDEH